jgi:hypothetical protein
MNDSLISGKVFNHTGNPLTNLTVVAFNILSKSEEAIGKAMTDHGGYYKIKSFFQVKGYAKLKIKVFADDMLNACIGESEILFNAPDHARIDVVV